MGKFWTHHHGLTCNGDAPVRSISAGSSVLPPWYRSPKSHSGLLHVHCPPAWGKIKPLLLQVCFIYIYILFVKHLQEFNLTIKSWCPTLTPDWSASEPGWTEDTKMPLSFPPIRVISDSRFSPERERLCTGRTEFRCGPEDNEGRNGLEKKGHAQIKESQNIDMQQCKVRTNRWWRQIKVFS